MSMKMKSLTATGLCLLATCGAPQAGWTAGLESVGNADGVLTWQCQTLEPGKSAREVVFFVFDQSPETAAARLSAARAQFA